MARTITVIRYDGSDDSVERIKAVVGGDPKQFWHFGCQRLCLPREGPIAKWGEIHTDGKKWWFVSPMSKHPVPMEKGVEE